MADELTVEVRGFDELAAGTAKLARNIQQASSTAFAEVAERVAEQVAARVPRLTGTLAQSVEGGPRPDGGIVEMGDGVPYARFVEFGGRGHPHSTTGNYLYPTAIAAGELLERAAVEVANDEIGEMHWPSPM